MAHARSHGMPPLDREEIKHRAEDLTANDPRLREGALRPHPEKTPSLSQVTPGLDRLRPLRDAAIRVLAWSHALAGLWRERRARRRAGRAEPSSSRS